LDSEGVLRKLTKSEIAGGLLKALSVRWCAIDQGPKNLVNIGQTLDKAESSLMKDGSYGEDTIARREMWG
jgi:hypothetical protein